MNYPVNDIYPTIQGEGHKSGTPVVLVRLQGCNVGCSWCDTKESWKLDVTKQRDQIENVLGTNPTWTPQSGFDIAQYVHESYPKLTWVLLTGGEPADYDLTTLVNEFHIRDKKVMLETSGTALGHDNADLDWITVSPKLMMKKPFLTQSVIHADEIKMVVGVINDVLIFDQTLKSINYPEDCIISLQPVSNSKKALAICREEARKRNWVVSIQIHKHLGVR